MWAEVTGMGVKGRVQRLSGSRTDRAWEPATVRVREGVGTRGFQPGRQGGCWGEVPQWETQEDEPGRGLWSIREELSGGK